jgi:hypothetical protein
MVIPKVKNLLGGLERGWSGQDEDSMTKQEMAEGIIASAEANGIVLRAEGDQLGVEYLADQEPGVVFAELFRTCREDIVEVLKSRRNSMIV